MRREQNPAVCDSEQRTDERVEEVDESLGALAPCTCFDWQERSPRVNLTVRTRTQHNASEEDTKERQHSARLDFSGKHERGARGTREEFADSEWFRLYG